MRTTVQPGTAQAYTHQTTLAHPPDHPHETRAFPTTFLNGPTLHHVNDGSPIVTVRGHATRKTPPDYGHTTITVTSESPTTRADAITKTNAIAANISQALQNLPINALDRTQTRAQALTAYDAERLTHVHTGWTATTTLTLTAETITLSAALNIAATHGASITSTQWTIDPANPIKRETRRQAVQDAQNAAADYADALGLRISGLLSITDIEHLSSTPNNPAEPGTTPLTAQDITADPEPVTINAIVEATYILASQ